VGSVETPPSPLWLTASTRLILPIGFLGKSYFVPDQLLTSCGWLGGDHARGHRRRWESSWSKSCLSASFPVLLAIVMVSK
jgi:hypothetical protein